MTVAKSTTPAQKTNPRLPGNIRSRKSTLVHEVSKRLARASSATIHEDGPTTESPAREELLNLDGKCEYCESRPATTLDHFVPLVRHAKPTVYREDAWNLVPCCRECNSSKGGRTYEEWFRSTSSTCNPCRADVSPRRRARMWAKFGAYNQAFRASCTKTPEVDAAWWEDTVHIIESFLGELQMRVDAYACGTRTRAGHRGHRGHRPPPCQAEQGEE